MSYPSITSHERDNADHELTHLGPLFSILASDGARRRPRRVAQWYWFGFSDSDVTYVVFSESRSEVLFDFVMLGINVYLALRLVKDIRHRWMFCVMVNLVVQSTTFEFRASGNQTPSGNKHDHTPRLQ